MFIFHYKLPARFLYSYMVTT